MNEIARKAEQRQCEMAHIREQQEFASPRSESVKNVNWLK